MRDSSIFILRDYILAKMGSTGVEQEGNGQGGPEQFSYSEIAKRARDVLTEYATLSHEKIRPLIRAGEARQAIDFVRNRPGETQHLIDLVGENLLANLIRTHDLPSRLIGENNTIVPIEGSEILVDFAIDPLDNTNPLVKDLVDILPWSVVGAYNHKTKRPIGAVAVDIVGNRIYRAANGKVTVMDTETDIVRNLSISQRTDLSDFNVTIASFIGEKDYSLPFFDLFRPMIEEMDRKGYLHPGGGAFIYALMAAGAVDAYIMLNEPRSEVDPGLPLLLAGGGKAVSVDPETGTKTPYKFDPDLTSSGTVPLFLAYAQEPMADRIIELYLEGKRKSEEQTAALILYRELMMTPGEEYHLTKYLEEIRKQQGHPPVIPPSIA